eukprot:CAMPEP_0183369434 /NCGR_PEP_ID=MMETSP0164_2-20130417/99322_1 /TAXON_ID=221442 /ORGANISM="Coccolithus pelagicus ssp braarudi, Strain PLY182g" /LENGTH=280 /DNA_ID=CAMNT_0025545693 /DNA_START=39 /DNA_END=878 /DNA_ORIENTATION=-
MSSDANLDVVVALRLAGWAKVDLPVDSIIALRNSIEAVGGALKTLHAAHSESDSARACSGALSVAAFAERAQLRYEPAGPNQSEPSCATKQSVSGPKKASLEEVAATGTAVLAKVAQRALADLCESQLVQARPIQTRLDAFWYPACEYDTFIPCPAHEDPGLLTVVIEDASALQILSKNGTWNSVNLGPQECVLLAGRALQHLTHGSISACMHRVCAISSSRTSLVFEALPGQDHMRMCERLKKNASAVNGSVTERAAYERAVAVLLDVDTPCSAERSCA